MDRWESPRSRQEGAEVPGGCGCESVLAPSPLREMLLMLRSPPISSRRGRRRRRLQHLGGLEAWSAHGDLTSLAPHERLPEILVVVQLLEKLKEETAETREFQRPGCYCNNKINQQADDKVQELQ